MHISNRQTCCAVILSSAAIAAALTFGTTAMPSAVSEAVADHPEPAAMSDCDGQTWPNYSVDCLETISGHSPDRVLTLRGTH